MFRTTEPDGAAPELIFKMWLLAWCCNIKAPLYTPGFRINSVFPERPSVLALLIALSKVEKLALLPPTVYTPDNANSKLELSIRINIRVRLMIVPFLVSFISLQRFADSGHIYIGIHIPQNQ